MPSESALPASSRLVAPYQVASGRDAVPTPEKGPLSRRAAPESVLLTSMP
jgi:hypothetical protein